MAFENFPYTDLHTLNIDWLLRVVKTLQDVTDSKLTEASETLVREIFGDAVLNMTYDDNTKTLHLTVDQDPGTDPGQVEYIDVGTYHLEIADSYARSLLNSLSVNEVGFYNVKAYGAKGDGLADDIAALQHVMDLCHQDGGGMVFFPAGKYCISKNLVIPANTTVMGVGKASEIFMTISTNWSGEVICIGGDNVKLSNISGDLVNHGGSFILGQSNMGFIGVSNLGYEGWINEDYSTKDAIRKNVVIEDIYTDCYYAVQAELAASNCYLENIHYVRIDAPQGCISMSGGDRQPRGFINCSITDCACGLLRIMSGAGGYDQDIYLRNIRACYTAVYLQTGLIDGITVSVDETNPFYVNRTTWLSSLASGKRAANFRGNCTMHNIKVLCNNAPAIEIGLNIIVANGETTTLIGCQVFDVPTVNTLERDVNINSGSQYLVGCLFTGPESGMNNGHNLGSVITGTIVGQIKYPTWA